METKVTYRALNGKGEVKAYQVSSWGTYNSRVVKYRAYSKLVNAQIAVEALKDLCSPYEIEIRELDFEPAFML